MGKQAYLDALKRAMAGLPPDVVAKTLAYYEQRFIDGLAAGHSEAEISADLDEPRKIAMTLRANRHLSDFERSQPPRNVLRQLFSLAGLAIFNLFMVIPAAVYAALLASLYCIAFALYIGGVAVTASGLSGVNELVLDGPLHNWIQYDDEHDADADAPMQTKLTIGDGSVQIHEEAMPGPGHGIDGRRIKLLQRAEELGGGSLHISADEDSDSRGTQTAIGLVMVIGGILVSLLSLVVTRYTVIGIKRYAAMNFSLLRGR